MAWHHRLRNLFRGARLDDDIDRELAFHLAERIDALVESGLSREEAARAARRQFGSRLLQQERTREADTVTWLESVARDVRHAVRSFARSPGFTAVAVLMLAAGIGGITTLFTVVNGVVFRPFPYVPDPDGLVSVRAAADAVASGEWERAHWRERRTIFQETANNFGLGRMGLLDAPGAEISGIRVTPEYFSVIGVTPSLGRDFIAAADAIQADTFFPETGAAVLVSHALWRTHLAGDPEAVGQSVRLTEEDRSGRYLTVLLTIVGVMPEGFVDPQFPSIDFWVVVRPSPPGSASFGLGRLRPGVTLEAARSQITGVELLPAGRVNVFDPSLLVLVSIAGGLLLALTIADLGNLVLARTLSRGHELALRVTLGCGKRRLVQQLFTENLLLAIAGGAAGLGVALAGAPLLAASIEDRIPRVGPVPVDLSVLGFLVLVTGVTALALTIGPVLAFSRMPSGRLQEGSAQASESRRSRAYRQCLIGGEIALAGSLLTVAAAAGIGLWNLRHDDPGLEREGLMVVRVSLPDPADVDQSFFYDRALTALRAVPGVISASLAWGVPVQDDCRSTAATVDGRLSNYGFVLVCEASSGYFATLGVGLTEGRSFSDAGDEIVVNDAFARVFWPGEESVGRLIEVVDRGFGGRAAEARESLRVAGVVPWLGGLRRLQELPAMYRLCERCSTLVLRVRDDSVAPAAIRNAVSAAGTGVLVRRIETLEEAWAGRTGSLRTYASLFGAFAAVGVTLAFGGAYGVASYLASRRRREAGIRMALGATRGTVVRQMMRGLRAAVLLGGIGGAWGGAVLVVLAGTTILAPLGTGFPGAGAGDLPAVVLGVGLALMAVVLLASVIPILRLSSIDLADVLRPE